MEKDILIYEKKYVNTEIQEWRAFAAIIKTFGKENVWQ